MGKQGACGGVHGICSESNRIFEALGPGYTRHYYTALASGGTRIDGPKLIEALYTLQELPDGRIELRGYEYARGKNQANPDRQMRATLGESIENAWKGFEKLDLSAMKFSDIAARCIGSMIRDFPKLRYTSAPGARPSIMFPMETEELGLPVDCHGENRIYLNGPGYSTQPDNSIVMYAQQITLYAIERYEYARGKLNVKMFTVRADGGYEKIHDQTMPLAEARRSPASLMLEFLQDAAQEFYGTRAL